ncbi:MAG: hypothetical protein ACOX7J_00190 [Bacillota bacterium]
MAIKHSKIVGIKTGLKQVLFDWREIRENVGGRFVQWRSAEGEGGCSGQCVGSDWRQHGQAVVRVGSANPRSVADIAN